MRKITVLILLFCQLLNVQTILSIETDYHLSLDIIDLYHIPFGWVNNLIVVHAEVNGLKGYLVVDTGIEALILNSEYFNGRDRSISILDPLGSTQKTQMCWADVSLSGYLFTVKEALIISLKNAYNKGTPILGMFGWKAFQGQTLVIDKLNQELIIASENINHDIIDTSSKDQVLSYYPLKRSGQGWFTQLEINDQVFNFLVDTGAEINLLISRAYKSISSFCNTIGNAQVNFFGSRKVLEKVQLNESSLAESSLTEFSCVVIPKLSYNQYHAGVRLHGVIGMDLFKFYDLVSLDFQNGQIILSQTLSNPPIDESQ